MVPSFTLRKRHQIFISHAWAYSDRYHRLVGMLNKADFPYFNHSVPEHDPLVDPETPIGKNTLTLLLAEQINKARHILVIAGMYVAHKYWIQKEIDIAKQLGKHIIGISPWGSERTPQEVTEAADVMVGWNTDSIINAIKGKTQRQF